MVLPFAQAKWRIPAGQKPYVPAGILRVADWSNFSPMPRFKVPENNGNALNLRMPVRLNPETVRKPDAYRERAFLRRVAFQHGKLSSRGQKTGTIFPLDLSWGVNPWLYVGGGLGHFLTQRKRRGQNSYRNK